MDISFFCFFFKERVMGQPDEMIEKLINHVLAMVYLQSLKSLADDNCVTMLSPPRQHLTPSMK